MGHIANIPKRLEAIIDNPTSLHSFKHHAREILNETGHLPQTQLWDYLHWRRGLNPARFDAHHPFDKLFHDEGQHQPIPTTPEIPTTPVIPTLPCVPCMPTPTPPGGTHVTPPPTSNPGVVAEPTSAIPLGLAMVLLLAWYIRRR